MPKYFIFFTFFLTWLSSPISLYADESSSPRTQSEKDEEKASSDEAPIKTYLDLKALVVPVIKRDKVVAYARLSIQVATKDNSSIDPFRPYKNRLIDAYFKDLFQGLCDQWLPGKDPKEETIHKRLSKVTDTLVGPNKLLTIITNFYFYKPETTTQKTKSEGLVKK